MDYITSNGNNTSETGNSQLILKGPLSINTQIAFSLNMPPTLPNYTFSFWLYINNSPISNTSINPFNPPNSYSDTNLGNIETAIFKYGPNAPYITINNNRANNMVIYASDKPSPFNVLTQKWNYLVIQYTGTVADLYINCDHIISIPIHDIVYAPGDNIILGNYKKNNSSDEVSTGAISNVMYYTNPLTLSQMNTQYELLSTQIIPNGF
jgi:hypothetical protein